MISSGIFGLLIFCWLISYAVQLLIQIELLDRHCWPGAASHPGDGARSQERGAGARGPQTASSHRLDNEVRGLPRPRPGPHPLWRSVSGSMLDKCDPPGSPQCND